MPSVIEGKLFFEEQCDPRRVMELISSKWTSLVIHALYHWPGGKCRTGNLQRSLHSISRKMLVQTLRDIEQRGLVYRYIYDTIPPKVEYELTPLGRKFAEPIEALYLWGEMHKNELDTMEKNIAASLLR